MSECKCTWPDCKLRDTKESGTDVTVLISKDGHESFRRIVSDQKLSAVEIGAYLAPDMDLIMAIRDTVEPETYTKPVEDIVVHIWGLPDGRLFLSCTKDGTPDTYYSRFPHDTNRARFWEIIKNAQAGVDMSKTLLGTTWLTSKGRLPIVLTCSSKGLSVDFEKMSAGTKKFLWF